MMDRAASTTGSESSPALEQARQRVGAVLRGKWRLDALIGIGGMGAVYAATHRNGRRAAIKVLLPFHGADTRTVRRFLKEGYVANELAHPSAVEIFDDDYTEDGLPFLVMELLHGQSLKARLEAPPHRLEVQEALRVGAEILSVLAVAHERGIVHRDVKPDNVFLLEDGRVKLLDFGIARLRRATDADTTTSSGAALGTAAFMPPEQARGKADEVDARSDLFGVGALLFVSLSGQPLRNAESAGEQLYLAMTEPVRPLCEIMPEAPEELATVVDRALAFAPDERWSSANAMRDALLAASPTLARMGSLQSMTWPIARPKPRRPFVAWLMITGLLLAGGGLTLALGRSDALSPRPVQAVQAAAPTSHTTSDVPTTLPSRVLTTTLDRALPPPPSSSAPPPIPLPASRNGATNLAPSTGSPPSVTPVARPTASDPLRRRL